MGLSVTTLNTIKKDVINLSEVAFSFSFQAGFRGVPMYRINRKIEYALMALKQMSQKTPGELTTAKEVCDQLKTPFDATARVMQIMANKGLLRSEHGAFGGYQIFKDLSKVSLFDLIEMIEGKQSLVKCIHREGGVACEIETTCNIGLPLASLNQKLNEFYRGISLRDLLIESGPARASRRKSPHEVIHG